MEPKEICISSNELASLIFCWEATRLLQDFMNQSHSSIKNSRKIDLLIFIFMNLSGPVTVHISWNATIVLVCLLHCTYKPADFMLVFEEYNFEKLINITTNYSHLDLYARKGSSRKLSFLLYFWGWPRYAFEKHDKSVVFLQQIVKNTN